MGLPPEELSLPAEGCPDGWDGCRRKNRGQDLKQQQTTSCFGEWVAWCQLRGRGAMGCCDLKRVLQGQLWGSCCCLGLWGVSCLQP